MEYVLQLPGTRFGCSDFAQGQFGENFTIIGLPDDEFCWRTSRCFACVGARLRRRDVST
jgi:hypothetical protein